MNNYVQSDEVLDLALTTGVSAGDPVCIGQLVGVAIVDIPNNGTGAVATEGVYRLSVKAVDGAGNSAVAVGDALYYVDADAPKLSKKATGVLYGYALETIAAGATATIKVKLADK